MKADYTELVKFLNCQRIDCEECPMHVMMLTETNPMHEVWSWHCCAKDAADAIEELKSISRKWKEMFFAQPSSSGKWVPYYECPICGEISSTKELTCPFCGADMGEES